MIQGRGDDDGANRRRKPRRATDEDKAINRAGPAADGRIQKGEVRNPWGPRGNPEKRAQRKAYRNVGILTLFEREMRRIVPITEDGRVTNISILELAVKKAVRDLLEGPVKTRVELLLGRRSVFREILDHPEPDEEEGAFWTAELEKEYQIVKELYDLDGDLDSDVGPPRDSGNRDGSEPRDDGEADDEFDLRTGMLDN